MHHTKEMLSKTYYNLTIVEYLKQGMSKQYLKSFTPKTENFSLSSLIG